MDSPTSSTPSDGRSASKTNPGSSFDGSVDENDGCVEVGLVEESSDGLSPNFEGVASLAFDLNDGVLMTISGPIVTSRRG